MCEPSGPGSWRVCRPPLLAGKPQLLEKPSPSSSLGHTHAHAYAHLGDVAHTLCAWRGGTMSPPSQQGAGPREPTAPTAGWPFSPLHWAGDTPAQSPPPPRFKASGSVRSVFQDVHLVPPSPPPSPELSHPPKLSLCPTKHQLPDPSPAPGPHQPPVSAGPRLGGSRTRDSLTPGCRGRRVRSRTPSVCPGPSAR